MFVVFLCSVESSRWFTWVVRVGVPSKILKPHSQISRLGMTTYYHVLRTMYYYVLRNVDHLLTCVYFSTLCLLLLYCCLLFIFLPIFVFYFSKLLRLGFLTHYSIILIFLSC